MNGLETTAKYIITLGLAILIMGTILLVSSKLGLKPFHLPGDIVIKRGNFTFYFPWVSSIVLSLILTIIFSILARR